MHSGMAVPCRYSIKGAAGNSNVGFAEQERGEEKMMERSNSSFAHSIGFIDDKRNFIELIGNGEERLKGFNQIISAYCNRIR